MEIWAADTCRAVSVGVVGGGSVVTIPFPRIPGGRYAENVFIGGGGWVVKVPFRIPQVARKFPGIRIDGGGSFGVSHILRILQILLEG